MSSEVHYHRFRFERVQLQVVLAAPVTGVLGVAVKLIVSGGVNFSSDRKNHRQDHSDREI